MRIKGDRFYRMENGNPCHIEEVWTTAKGVTAHGWTIRDALRDERHAWDGEGRSLADPQCDIVEEMQVTRWGFESSPATTSEGDPRGESE